eukprot:NODE_20_length_3443_cov_19.289204_g11_i0.p1 GENE.NODE_20_length_3443_cov_19.289204_g11_i0~~NODE_20_length_3443_cov_19.289204_g11_i0.p1  ORF type:complete len:1042 (+),score=139.16 NODE_20_length_3443_cov_19.289204_g11_i0:256-3381(+)
MDNRIPKLFVCPITLELMKDPTITTCGHMFERDAIEDWLSGFEAKDSNAHCPICNQPITKSQLSPCYPMKTAIEDFLQDGQDRPKSSISNIKDQFSKGSLAKLKDNFGKKLKIRKRTVSSKPVEEKKAPASPEPKTPWARLVPLSRQYDQIDIIKSGGFLIGRNGLCDAVINKGQISGRHCNIYRVRRDSERTDGPFPYDCFLEDLSTNGTYVNGKRPNKEDPVFLAHRDEISLGNRFTSQEKPQMKSFVDWVFLGTLRSSNIYDDINKLKNLPSFDDSLELTDETLKTQVGIEHEEVRTKFLAATKSWNNEHQLPVFRFEVVDLIGVDMPAAEPTRQPSLDDASSLVFVEGRRSSRATRPARPQPSADQGSRQTIVETPFTELPPMALPAVPVATADPITRFPAAAPPPPLPQAIADVERERAESGVPSSTSNPAWAQGSGFAPATYMQSMGAGTVQLTLRRVELRGRLTLLISTTSEGTAIPGKEYNPVSDAVVTFLDRSDTTSYTFTWTPVTMRSGVPVVTINFVLKTLEGQLVTGSDSTESTCVLILEGDSTDYPTFSNSPSSVPKDDPLLRKMTNAFSDMSVATLSGVIARERNNSNSDNDEDSLEHTIYKKVMWYRNLPDDQGTPSATGVLPSPFVPTWDSKRFDQEVDHQEENQRPLSPTQEPHRHFLLQTDLEPYILIHSMHRLRESEEYMNYLNENYWPTAAHRASLLSSVCHEVMNYCMQQAGSYVNGNLAGQLAYVESDIDVLIKSTCENVMTNLLSIDSSQATSPLPPLNSGFDVSFSGASYLDQQSSPSVSTVACIEDLNSLVNLDESVPLHSFYGVFEGHSDSSNNTIAFRAAQWASMYIPITLIKYPELTHNFSLSVDAAFTRTNAIMDQKNGREHTIAGSYVSSIILRGSDIYLCWLGPMAPVVVYEENSRFGAVSYGNASAKESLGYQEADNMAESQSKTPQVQKLALPNSQEPRIIVLANRLFWKSVTPDDVAASLSQLYHDKKPATGKHSETFVNEVLSVLCGLLPGDTDVSDLGLLVFRIL